MRDFLAWNVSLGRWGGVHVRLHAIFLLLVVVALHLAARPDADGLLGYTLMALGVLFVSVLVHEIGHVAAARRIGGSADQILLWPLGGLMQVSVSHDPDDELLVAAAGPAVNLVVCIACVPVLLVVGSSPAEVARLFNPFVPPPGTDQAAMLTMLELAVWMNWLLVLVNLLPAFPLDMGQILRALLWRRTGFRTAVTLVSRAARLTAILLVVLAWLVHQYYPFASLPLSLVGILLFFSAREDRQRVREHDADELPGGYDFSQGYTSLERQERDQHGGPAEKQAEGWLRRWLRERDEAQRQRQQQLEAEEERRADDILARLHESGPDALSADDRALLARVSQRYRNRSRG